MFSITRQREQRVPYRGGAMNKNSKAVFIHRDNCFVTLRQPALLISLPDIFGNIYLILLSFLTTDGSYLNGYFPFSCFCLSFNILSRLGSDVKPTQSMTKLLNNVLLNIFFCLFFLK